jgi:WD40 repeat protein
LFKDHTGPVCGVQLTSDDALLVTGSGDFAVMIWDIEKEMIIVSVWGFTSASLDILLAITQQGSNQFWKAIYHSKAQNVL